MVYITQFFILIADSAANECVGRGAKQKVLRGIFQPNIPLRLNYIKKYVIIIIYKRRIIMIIKKCDRCKQEKREENIETCLLPDFDKNNGIIGSWTIYGRPFKYIDLCYSCKKRLEHLLDDFLEGEL